MASKLPFLKFFVDDWLAEERLRICSLAARGLWIDMLSLMHKGGRRGFLVQANGQPMTNEQLARIAGCSTAEVGHLCQELLTTGVSAADEHGAIFSRRMVRDEALSKTRSAAGMKGGNPALLKQQDKHEDKRPLASGSLESPLENLGDARGKENLCAPDLLKQNTQPDLANLWGFHQLAKRNGVKRDSPEDVAPAIAEMIRLGTPEETIRAAILDKARDRTEYFWQFKKRFERPDHGKPLGSNSRSRDATDSILAQVARKAAKAGHVDGAETTPLAAGQAQSGQNSARAPPAP